MTPTEEFIAQKLEALKEGERSHLRRLAGKPLDESVAGFDLFTGLWWPLRQGSPMAPRREPSWLVAKLYGRFPIPHVCPEQPHSGATLPRLLGQLEPGDEHGMPRFRRRFDALLCSSLLTLEPNLIWALSMIADAVKQQKASGVDWVQLLDDLSVWDRGEEHRRRDVRDIWAETYLNAVQQQRS